MALVILVFGILYLLNLVLTVDWPECPNTVIPIEINVQYGSATPTPWPTYGPPTPAPYP